jgi:UDP-N-acetylmuramyl pentapeptide synthase
MWILDEIIEAVRGIPYRIERREFTGISIDSRAIREGELFVPIKAKTLTAMTLSMRHIRGQGRSHL